MLSVCLLQLFEIKATNGYLAHLVTLEDVTWCPWQTTTTTTTSTTTTTTTTFTTTTTGNLKCV